jgi:hypothetical protein
MGAVAVAAVDPDGIELQPLECLTRSFARVPAYLFLGFVIFLSMVGLSVPFGIGMAMFGATGGDVRTMIIVMGIVICVVVLWLYLCFCLTVPAMVIEELNSMQALRRSRDLTRGNRLKILAVFIVLGILPGLAMGWAAWGEISGGGALGAPSTQYAIFTGLLVLAVNVVNFALLGVIYGHCTSFSDSARVDDFSQVF